MPKGAANPNPMQKMRDTNVSPAVIVVLILVIVVSVGYFAFVRPARDAEQAKRDWITPEAQAKRSPEGRHFSSEQQSVIERLKAKEQSQFHGGAHSAP